jgi:hypothetical protein
MNHSRTRILNTFFFLQRGEMFHPGTKHPIPPRISRYYKMKHTTHTNMKWKGQTYQQLIQQLRKNEIPDITLCTPNPMIAQPLKLYRHELITNPGKNTLSRHITIDSISRPGGTSLWGTYTSNNTTTTSENILMTPYKEGVMYADTVPSTCCSSNNNIQQQARQRVRKISTMNPSYSSTTKQYLVKRQKSFSQNQYHYRRNNEENGYAQLGDITTCTTSNDVQNYYHPNNSLFATHGAVQSSTYIVQKQHCVQETCDASKNTIFSISQSQQPLPGGR